MYINQLCQVLKQPCAKCAQTNWLWQMLVTAVVCICQQMQKGAASTISCMRFDSFLSSICLQQSQANNQPEEWRMCFTKKCNIAYFQYEIWKFSSLHSFYEICIFILTETEMTKEDNYARNKASVESVRAFVLLVFWGSCWPKYKSTTSHFYNWEFFCVCWYASNKKKWSQQPTKCGVSQVTHVLGIMKDLPLPQCQQKMCGMHILCSWLLCKHKKQKMKPATSLLCVASKVPHDQFSAFMFCQNWT